MSVKDNTMKLLCTNFEVDSSKTGVRRSISLQNLLSDPLRVPAIDFRVTVTIFAARAYVCMKSYRATEQDKQPPSFDEPSLPTAFF